MKLRKIDLAEVRLEECCQGSDPESLTQEEFDERCGSNTDLLLLVDAALFVQGHKPGYEAALLETGAERPLLVVTTPHETFIVKDGGHYCSPGAWLRSRDGWGAIDESRTFVVNDHSKITRLSAR